MKTMTQYSWEKSYNPWETEPDEFDLLLDEEIELENAKHGDDISLDDLEIEELELDESCHPYEYFLSTRFAIHEEDIEKLNELIQDCSDADFSVRELVKEINLTGLI